MIISSYIFREILKAQAVIAAILLLIFVSQSAIRLISSAASGQLPVSLVSTLTLYALPGILALMLPLTLFIAILLTLGRIGSDSEMVIFRAVGYSPARLLALVLALGAVTAALCSWCSLDLAPRAAAARAALLAQARSSPAYLPFESGRFLSFGPYSIYAERITGAAGGGSGGGSSGSGDGGGAAATGLRDLYNLYVLTSGGGQHEISITVAREGRIEVDGQGVQWLLLSGGRRYEGPLAAGRGFRSVTFEHFRAPIAVLDGTQGGDDDLAARSYAELLSSPRTAERLEAQWRVAPLLAALVLCLTAVPLSQVSPRQGRFARLLPALLLYAIYYMLLLAVRNMINTGRFPLAPGLYAVPLLYALAVTLPLNLSLPALRARLRRRS